MEPRYVRNIIHMNAREQVLIKDFKILLGGCGIGSVIAETLLRLGFENLTVVDGDLVELSNLNRQNYTEADIGTNKAQALRKRLLDIDSNANIEAIPEYITVGNLPRFKAGYHVAINALDFSTDIPFLFDEAFCQLGIPVIHPYNLGWAGFVTVITATSRNMESLEQTHQVFELNVGMFIIDHMKKNGIRTEWFEDFLEKYREVALTSPPPQLSIGLSLLSGMVGHIIFDIATGKPFKKFPESYYLSLKE